MKRRVWKTYHYWKSSQSNGEKIKLALIKSILDSSKLHNRSHAYLTTLIQNLEQIGLSKQETFGTIINLGIYGAVLEEVGYSYTNLLLNANNCWESIGQYKNKIRTKVSEEAIDIATARNVWNVN